MSPKGELKRVVLVLGEHQHMHGGCVWWGRVENKNEKNFGSFPDSWCSPDQLAGIVPVLKFPARKRQKFASGMGDPKEGSSEKKLSGPYESVPGSSSDVSPPASLGCCPAGMTKRFFWHNTSLLPRCVKYVLMFKSRGLICVLLRLHLQPSALL